RQQDQKQPSRALHALERRQLGFVHGDEELWVDRHLERGRVRVGELLELVQMAESQRLINRGDADRGGQEDGEERDHAVARLGQCGAMRLHFLLTSTKRMRSSASNRSKSASSSPER